MKDAILVRKAPAPPGAPHKDMLLPADSHAAAALAALPIAETIAVKVVRERSLPMHRLFFGILQHVAENSRFETAERLLVALKIRLGRYDLCRLPNGRCVPVPQSISFAAMDQTEFRRFFDDAVKLICEEVLGGMDSAQLIRDVEAMLGLPPLPQSEPTPAAEGAGTAARGPEPVEGSRGDPGEDVAIPIFSFRAGAGPRDKANAFHYWIEAIDNRADLLRLQNRNAAALVELGKSAPAEYDEVMAAFRARHVALGGAAG